MLAKRSRYPSDQDNWNDKLLMDGSETSFSGRSFDNLMVTRQIAFRCDKNKATNRLLNIQYFRSSLGAHQAFVAFVMIRHLQNGIGLLVVFTVLGTC